MFETLTKKLSGIFDPLRGRGFISEEDLSAALRQIRIALLEADVSLPVVKDFIEQIRVRALGHEVVKSVSPGQMIIKIVHEHLIHLLSGGEAENPQPLNLSSKPPACIMLVGLQGAGKTTSAGKLAKYITEKLNKRVLLVSLDVYRPAAQEQLEILAKNLSVQSLEIIPEQRPMAIVKRALDRAKQGSFDVILFDTAGRLHIDESLMDEIQKIHGLLQPIETLLVADAMTGQDAVTIAKGFQAVVPITGLILTRVDGDSRGGAALSMRAVTGCPIKFLGIGERSENLEIFQAKRLADRILDMGDIVSLVERASELEMSEESERSMKRMQKGQFDLNDFAVQLKQMLKIGGLSGMMSYLPGMGKLKEKIASSGIDDRVVQRQLAIIQSMTSKERVHIQLLNASRRRRIAKGSGVQVSDVNRLIKQYEQTRDMMKKVQKMNPKKMGHTVTDFLKRLT